MSALMSDVIEGHVTPALCNSSCKAGANLLKVVELQMRYAVPAGKPKRQLMLTGTFE